MYRNDILGAQGKLGKVRSGLESCLWNAWPVFLPFPCAIAIYGHVFNLVLGDLSKSSLPVLITSLVLLIMNITS